MLLLERIILRYTLVIDCDTYTVQLYRYGDDSTVFYRVDRNGLWAMSGSADSARLAYASVLSGIRFQAGIYHQLNQTLAPDSPDSACI